MGGCPRGAKHPHTLLAKRIHHTSRQRPLWSHYCDCYLFSSSPGPQGKDIRDIHILKPGVPCCAAVARRHVHLVHLG